MTLSRRSFLVSLGLSAFAGLLATGCNTTGASVAEARSSRPRQTQPNATPDAIKAFAAAQTTFGLALFQQLRAGNGNLFFSPYSIAQALTMVYAGAQGRTAEQLASVVLGGTPADRVHPTANALNLALTSPASTGSEGGLELSIANGLWGQKDNTFTPTFLDLLAENYGAGLQLVDFAQQPEAARTTINNAVAQQTKDKIKDLLPSGSVSTATRLVLTNAIYFNAKWRAPFEAESTQDGPFAAPSGEKTAKFMRKTGTFAYGEGDNYQAVELPYIGNASMVVFLPAEGQLDTFVATLDGARFGALVDGLQWNQVQLQLPKFTYTSDSVSLKDTLLALSIRDAFDPAQADFSGMDGTRDLFISDVLHKAFVRVDEAGTEAAAATAAGMATTSAPAEQPKQMVVNRPFVFAIRDTTTNALLFVGRIVEPNAV